MRDTDGAYRRLCLSKRGGGSSSSSSDGRRLSTQEPVYFLPNWHRRNIFIFLKKKKKIHFSLGLLLLTGDSWKDKIKKNKKKKCPLSHRKEEGESGGGGGSAEEPVRFRTSSRPDCIPPLTCVRQQQCQQRQQLILTWPFDRRSSSSFFIYNTPMCVVKKKKGGRHTIDMLKGSRENVPTNSLASFIFSLDTNKSRKIKKKTFDRRF